jgi:hypothetical protein
MSRLYIYKLFFGNFCLNLWNFEVEIVSKAYVNTLYESIEFVYGLLHGKASNGSVHQLRKVRQSKMTDQY